MFSEMEKYKKFILISFSILLYQIVVLLISRTYWMIPMFKHDMNFFYFAAIFFLYYGLFKVFLKKTSIKVETGRARLGLTSVGDTTNREAEKNYKHYKQLLFLLSGILTILGTYFLIGDIINHFGVFINNLFSYAGISAIIVLILISYICICLMKKRRNYFEIDETENKLYVVFKTAILQNFILALLILQTISDM